jgi:hypothetical protein
LALTDRKVTIMVTDTQRWAVFTHVPWRRSMSVERAPYVPDGRHEVAAIAGRIAGGFAVVLALAGSLAYLIVRVLVP